MRKSVLLLPALFFLAAPALAQGKPPEEYDFKLKAAYADAVVKALAKMPYEEAAPIMQEIFQQVKAQQEAANKDPKKK